MHTRRYFKAYWRVRAERLLASGLDEIRLQSRLDRIRKVSSGRAQVRTGELRRPG
jgi:outer membrane PBP1 activator LpoA protein